MRTRLSRLAGVVALCLVPPLHAAGQEVSQRGFVEVRGIVYPQEGPSDPTRLVGDLLFRQEAFWRARPWLTFAGAFDARADTHDRVHRGWSVDWGERGARRPALAVRRASVAVRRGGLSVEAGKQFVRWGKADVLNPTDRFAPRDFLDVVDNDFLGVTALRAVWERQADTVEGVWVPRFTPSRIPLPTDRWAGLSTSLVPAANGLGTVPFVLVDLGARYPGRSQFGVRWNRVGARFEYSLSFYDGFNHLPRFEAVPIGLPGSPQERQFAPGIVEPTPVALQFWRFHSRMRMVGGDLAVPTRWVTIKGEAGYFTSSGADADDYGRYVLQVERQAGEWFFAGGYAGEFVRKRRGQSGFAPDRGLANSFLARASYTLDATRDVAFEGVVRRNGDGAWVKAEYSQSVGGHWRVTARTNLIGGNASDFLGQYRRNSNVEAILRFSF